MNIKHRLLLCIVLLGVGGIAQAQVTIYRGCIIDNVSTFEATMTQFYNSLSAVKPTTRLDKNIFSGESEVTHLVLETFPDYGTMEAFRNDIQVSRDPLSESFNSSGFWNCINEGLSVEMGFWGNRDDRGDYTAVYDVTTTDAPNYVAAFEEFAEAIIDNSPGPIGLYENRAGYRGATHFLVFWAPTLTALNETTDMIAGSEAYAEILDEVRDIRTISVPEQRQTIRTWGE